MDPQRPTRSGLVDRRVDDPCHPGHLCVAAPARLFALVRRVSRSMARLRRVISIISSQYLAPPNQMNLFVTTQPRRASMGLDGGPWKRFLSAG